MDDWQRSFSHWVNYFFTLLNVSFAFQRVLISYSLVCKFLLSFPEHLVFFLESFACLCLCLKVVPLCFVLEVFNVSCHMLIYIPSNWHFLVKCERQGHVFILLLVDAQFSQPWWLKSIGLNVMSISSTTVKNIAMVDSGFLVLVHCSEYRASFGYCGSEVKTKMKYFSVSRISLSTLYCFVCLKSIV